MTYYHGEIILYHFLDGNKNILEAKVIVQPYFLSFKIYAHVFCVIF
jgi:hypothetical protein